MVVSPRQKVLAYAAAAWVAQACPAPLARSLGAHTGVSASRHVSSMVSRRAMVARHLRRVYGDDLDAAGLEDKVDETFASYGRYWVESLRLPGTPFPKVDAGMSWQGIGHIVEATEAGRGCILALPHLGGWEWAGMWLIQQGFPMTVVVEALDPPELFEWFVSFRRSLGMEIVPVGRQAGSAVLRALKANQVVSLLCDRNIGDSSGVDVEFFGERTELPGGPATLALRTGAALLPTAVYFDDELGGHFGLVRPPLDTTRQATLRRDVQRLTQELAFALEDLIRRAPSQWHLLQPNWPSDSVPT
jgi:KDO2-lipid IV(A) lauroyltransferase